MTEIVAEISGNHDGSLTNAVLLIKEAKQAGCDAVKFQCFEPDQLAARRVGIIWKGVGMTFDALHELYSKTHTPKDWFPTLIAAAEEVGIAWFSSVFDPYDVHYLETLDCPRYKISAYEMLNGDLIKAVVATGKPIIMSVRSTPLATVLVATPYDGKPIALGLSMHTKDIRVAVGCSIAGAPVVEAHLRLPDVDCEDADFSYTPEQMAELVKMVKGRIISRQAL